MEVLFDGCAVGMKSKDDHPKGKPWKLMTTSKRVKVYFENMKCCHDRDHVNVGLSKEGIFTKDKKHISYSAMAFDMADYAQQTVDHYQNIAKVEKLKHASTPLVPDGSITSADEEMKGELAPNACRILMTALWLGRLARPDIIKPINDLATKVQAWTKAEDKKATTCTGQH